MIDDDIEELRRDLLDAHDNRSPGVNPVRTARRPCYERQRQQIAAQDELVGETVRTIRLLATPAPWVLTPRSLSLRKQKPGRLKPHSRRAKRKGM